MMRTRASCTSTPGTSKEPVFGIIKEASGFRRFTYKGLENVKGQWSLICTTFNLKKMYGIWAKEKLKLA